ncbi:MAG: arginine deiminase [Oscillospiraceae bacterium]|jgi:arginine deiminase
MPIRVENETGELRRVVLQRPGRELEHLSPDTMEALLFDDIPYLYGAQAEHDRFAEILREAGAQVLYLEDLVVEAISTDPGIRDRFIADAIDRAGGVASVYRDELFRYLSGIEDLHEMVSRTIEGISLGELSSGDRNSLPWLVQPQSHFVMDPIPNIYFTRDPFASIGRGVCISHMNTVTRQRETLYGEYIFKYHPDFRDVPIYYSPDIPLSIEGGDIQNLSSRVVAVGISQRTQPEAVERLASAVFSDEESSVETILAVEIPRSRAFMHLDTVFTQVDCDKFLIHPGVVDSMRVFELTGKGTGSVRARELDEPLEKILCRLLGLDGITMISCGGKNRIASEREQWNDGSNTLCLSPGKVVVYDRNYVTNEALEEAGVEIIKLPSSELSRGRGGPHCMSMPLERGI